MHKTSQKPRTWDKERSSNLPHTRHCPQFPLPWGGVLCILRSTMTHRTQHPGHATYKASCPHNIWQHFLGHLSVLWITALASSKNLWRNLLPSSVRCSYFTLRSNYRACGRCTCSIGTLHFYNQAILGKNQTHWSHRLEKLTQWVWISWINCICMIHWFDTV